MHYLEFQGEKLSVFGLGTMRLPVIDDDNSRIDQAATQEMVDCALAAGVNYFDTAWGYHGGQSEVACGKALAKHDRASFNVATKFPGYDVANFGKHEEIFATQLERLQMEYVDFYLLHNICERNIEHYLDEERFGTEAFFMGQKRAGRIRHLGFSTHANFDNFKRFLDRFAKDMEFCQIEVNYLDWDFQDAKRKVEYCEKLGIPVWVMEPLRGGYLVNLDEGQRARLAEANGDMTPVEWAFRWLLTKLPNSVVLTGSSTLGQLQDSLRIFNEHETLAEGEMAAVDALARDMAARIGLPCTACRYCVDHCPMELDIPLLLSLFNEYRSKEAKDGFIAPMTVGTLPKDKRPSACIACGACHDVCPQALEIPEALEELAEAVE